MKTRRVRGAIYNGIRRYVQAHDKFTVDQLIKVVPITRTQAINNVNRMVRDGEIRVIERGSRNVWEQNPKLTVFGRA